MKSIKQRYQDALDNISNLRAKHELEIEKARLPIKKLQIECARRNHPGTYKYTAMGDPGKRCDDCGYNFY